MNKNAGDGSGNDGKNSNNHGGKGGSSAGGGGGGGAGGGAGGPHDPTGLLDAASLFGKSHARWSAVLTVFHSPHLSFYSFSQLIGVAIQLAQQLQLHRIRSLTHSSMLPLPPVWACCQMLRAQQRRLLMTVTHQWQQQRQQLRAHIIIRIQWP